MNKLEKIQNLLIQENRIIKFGTITDETLATPLITIEVGESEISQHSINDKYGQYYPNYLISVFSTNYVNGYELMENLISEIKNATKQSMYLLHTKTFESIYDSTKQCYKFQAQFKEISIN